MRHSAAARKAAYVFLTLCCGALIAFGGFQFYKIYGPAKVTVEGIPFGLPAGSSVMLGDCPNFKQGISTLPAQTQSELHRAVELFRNGSMDAAFEIYDGIVTLFPELIPAVWGEINTLYEIGTLTEIQQDRLTSLVKRLENIFPNSGVSAYLDSRKAYLSGNSAVALELARIASEKAPALFEARLWFARLLLENSRLAQAADECRTAVSLSSGENSSAYDLLARIYHDQGLLDSCTALVDYALSQYPVDAELLLLKGYISEYQGHFDAADKIYQRILAFRPDYAPASEAAATLGEKAPPGPGTSVQLTPKDRAKVACDILEPLVQRYPENLPLREALGLAYLKARSFDLARAQFQEIMANDPEYPDIAQRIQESKATKRVVNPVADGLASDLKRAVDSLRSTMEPASTHDFSTMLGHYLVRYGATPQEFFKKYSMENFRPAGKNAWKETFFNGTYKHSYTVVFDSKNRFSEVHVVVRDTSKNSSHMGMAPEIFTRLLKQNSRISGIGNSTGETECDDGTVLDAAVWETQDNFEVLTRVVGKPSEVRMVRFDKSSIPAGLKLCDYIPYLNAY